MTSSTPSPPPIPMLDEARMSDAELRRGEAEGDPLAEGEMRARRQHRQRLRERSQRNSEQPTPIASDSSPTMSGTGSTASDGTPVAAAPDPEGKTTV